MIKTDGDLLTLEQLLTYPEIRPPLEFFEERLIQKVSPKLPHCYLQADLCASLNQFARPRSLGRGSTELRCTFGGVSLVFDISFFTQERLPQFTRKKAALDVLQPPDLAIEILSPGQTLGGLSARLRSALLQGTRLGWLIHPIRESVTVYRTRFRPLILRLGDALTGEDVLPGYLLPLDEMFGWLD